MINDKKRKILVVDNFRGWSRAKPILEENLECEIDIFNETRLARDALSASSTNGSYSLAIIDIYDSTKGFFFVQARIDFVKELNGQLPVLIFSKAGTELLERKYKLVLGKDYQVHVFKKYGSEGKLLERVRELTG